MIIRTIETSFPQWVKRTATLIRNAERRSRANKISKDCVSQMTGGRFILIVSLIDAAQRYASAARSLNVRKRHRGSASAASVCWMAVLRDQSLSHRYCFVEIDHLEVWGSVFTSGAIFHEIAFCDTVLFQVWLPLGYQTLQLRL